MTIDNATPQRFAAPARLDADLPSEEDQDASSAPGSEDANLHELFEAWSRWSRTRRYFAPPPPSGTILGKLSGKTRAFSSRPFDAECNMDLYALNKAIEGQPAGALDTQVFYLYYGHRIRHIKQAAEALKISRPHFYRLLNAFRLRVKRASLPIVEGNRVAREALPHNIGEQE